MSHNISQCLIAPVDVWPELQRFLAGLGYTLGAGVPLECYDVHVDAKAPIVSVRLNAEIELDGVQDDTTYLLACPNLTVQQHAIATGAVNPPVDDWPDEKQNALRGKCIIRPAWGETFDPPLSAVELCEQVMEENGLRMAQSTDPSEGV